MTFYLTLPGDLNLQDVATAIFTSVSVYAVTRVIYLLYFHPLSKYPGPRIAAVSNLWYAYHWLSGRWPWAIEDALRKYGDVVRIAPNELVFFTPQSFQDIYAPHQKNLEVFVKTDFNNRGKDLGGIIWEEDPVRHREVAKKVSHAFSNRAIRAMEPLIHKHMDYFVERMNELGAEEGGVGLAEWTHWLAMDLSADLSWNEQMNQMKTLKSSIYLIVLLSFNSFTTVMQVFKRFPLFSPFQYSLVPFRNLGAFVAMEQAVRKSVNNRIEQRGNTEHVDFFDYILPADSSAPTDPDEVTHIGSVSMQLMFAGFGTMADWYYGALFFLLGEPKCYELLTREIRREFQSYDEINPSALTALPYLHACLEESLRMFQGNLSGLPRVSPGTTVDGHYVPKGTYVQTSPFALARSPRYFHDPLHFRPERWLPSDHELHDPAFDNDELSRLFVFSLGPRGCPGKTLAWMEGKLFIAKILWTFDVVKVPRQKIDLENTLLHYGFLIKPELKVRFLPVNRSEAINRKEEQ